MKTPTFRDVELLSAYLDGKLSQADSARLESRIKVEPGLRDILDDLSQSRALLRKLPKRRAPRNFTLTPQMAGVKPPLPRAVPALRWATSLATLLLFATFAANAFAPSLASPSYMSLGKGGGGPEEALVMESAPAEPAAAEPAATEAAATESPELEAAPAVTETPLATQAPSMVFEPTEPIVSATEMGDAALQPTAQPLPTEDLALRNADAGPFIEPAPLAVPLAWQIGLLVVALASGGLAWILSQLADQTWRRKVK
ncbi:MAG: zf-HC2 domain-containing protein [Chloroflexi bacterium]|nr:zf-HC2 domain-containing protein [Chloroflexota bacterium]